MKNSFSDDNYITECQINAIGSLRNCLDSLRSQQSIDAMSCSMDCCLGNNLPGIIETLIEEPHLINLTQSIIGETGIKLLQEFESIFEKILYCDTQYYDYTPQYNVCHDREKQISRQQRWLAFFELVNKLDNHLKESVKNYPH